MLARDRHLDRQRDGQNENIIFPLQRGHKNKKTPRLRHFDVRPDHPRCRIRSNFNTQDGSQHIVPVFGFRQNRLRGFGTLKSRKLTFHQPRPSLPPYRTTGTSCDYRLNQNTLSQYESCYTISQKYVNIFAPNFAHLFGTKLCTNVLLCVYLLTYCVYLFTETQPSRTNSTTEQKGG